MNSILKSMLVLVLVGAVGVGAYYLGKSSGHDHAASPQAAGKEEKTLYTCGMHPQVIQDRPGNCPICGMKLTPIRKPAGGGDAAPVASSVIAVDPVTVQNMGIRTAEVVRGPLRRTIRTVGIVDYNETALADVTTKFKGWVEKLYVDATGQQVHRGDALFEIYSPELYSAQVEYLLVMQSVAEATPGTESLRASALTKLKYLDISEEQIAELDRTRQPRKTLRVFAPIDGFVVEKMVVEGQMIEAGMRTYRLADLALVWVHAQIYEQDLGGVKLGQEATMALTYLPDRQFRGRVTYLYPNVDEKTRTARVRMEFHNPGYFIKPGMFATVELRSELAPSALLVPDSAILRSGERKTVFVALAEGKFDPRTVTLGSRGENDSYQVLTGLEEGERVVTSGQFMLDSESQLREAIQKMVEPAKVGPAEPSGQPRAAVAVQAGAPPAEAGGAVIYLCPMLEHVSIEYDHSGQCPICGMNLVPVAPDTLSKLQPGGTLEYYTCPMPEHHEVHLDKPGKCPQCGMTLIPIMTPPPPPEVVPSPTKAPGATETLYTCPMASHAHVVSDQPGTCGECEMELVPTGKVKHGKEAEANWRRQHPAGPSSPPVSTDEASRPSQTAPEDRKQRP